MATRQDRLKQVPGHPPEQEPPDREPPPDHDDFVALRSASLRAMRDELARRKKKK